MYLLGKTPYGRGKVKLEWEVKPFGILFDGTGTGQSAAWYIVGVNGVAFGTLVDDLSPATLYHWRVRLRYDPVTLPWQSFTTTDPNPGETFTYTLVSETGNTDNASFSITDNALKTAAIFDYETKQSYSIRVRTTDLGGLWYEEAFTITVTDVVEPTGNSYLLWTK